MNPRTDRKRSLEETKNKIEMTGIDPRMVKIYLKIVINCKIVNPMSRP